MPSRRGYVKLFRGHGKVVGLDVQPGIFRSSNLQNEFRFIREFVSAFPQEFDRDSTTLEKLVRAQHFEIPTRLLDLSWNPLVALYFSCTSSPNENGEFLTFDVPKRTIKYYDSDLVSCLSNLSYLKEEDKITISSEVDRYIEGNIDEDEFNDTPSVQKLLYFIRSEKPHFLSKIDPEDLLHPVFVKPKLNNKRILSQNGAFSIFGLNEKFRTRTRRHFIDSIPIPTNAKNAIRLSLEKLAIHKSTMFPEVENAAQYIRSQVS